MEIINDKYLIFKKGTINMDNVMYFEVDNEETNSTKFTFINGDEISSSIPYDEIVQLFRDNHKPSDKYKLDL